MTRREHPDQLAMFSDNELEEGRALRDSAFTGMALKGKAFRHAVWSIVAQIPHGAIVAAEDIRARCEAAKIFADSSNAWGGITMGLIKAGKLVKTGDRAPMRSRASHAHGTDLYRVCHG